MPIAIRSPSRPAAALLLVLFAPLLHAGPGRPDGDDQPRLLQNAAALTLLYDGRERSGGEVERSMAPSVRVALNTWVDVAQAAALSVAIPREAQVLVLGKADGETLRRVAEVADDTWELLAPLRAEGDVGPAITLFVLDQVGMGGEPWHTVLDALVAQERLLRSDADRLSRSPAGLVAYRGDFVLQPGFDMVGNTSAGDDEFRLDNEVAHKLAVASLWSRHGHVPEVLRWGLGYLVEQRLFQSIYTFKRHGLVATDEHFDWPDRARDALGGLRKRHGDELPLVDLACDEASAGCLVTPQLVWMGVLDEMLAKRPDELRAMFGELAALHDEVARRITVGDYAGNDAATRAVLARHLGEVDAKALDKHLKRMK